MTPDNTLRHRGPGHVESWFVRLNDPSRPRAVWLKATILAPLEGAPVTEAWLVAFDGDAGRTWAWRDTVPLASATFSPTLSVAGLRLTEAGAVGGVGPASVELGWTSAMAPLCLFSTRAFIDGGFPRSKLLTPHPWLDARGTVRLPDTTWSCDGWLGMQGHNWGREHAEEYAWGQCVFPGATPAMVEAFTARVRVAGRLTPRLSALVVRRGDEELRFDTLFDPWRQEATLTEERWTLRLRGSAGEARLRMDGAGRPWACLGYRNPDGRMSYCFNSKLADTLLEVEPRHGAPFRCHAPHGGALELLRGSPSPALPVV